MAPQLIALNKLGELRNGDPTLYQVIQELQQQVNEYILRQAALPPPVVATAATPYSSLFAQTADSAAVTNTTTQTTILGTGVGSLTIPANRLVVGSTIRMAVRGTCSSGSGDTIAIAFLAGASTMVNVAAVTVPGGAGSGFIMDLTGTIRTTGAGGTIQFIGSVIFGTGTAALIFGTGSPGAIDTTAANLMDVQVIWSAAHANSTITSKLAVLEVF